MRVLAIDTSNLVLSVAVVEESRVLGELTTNLNKNHSVRLLDSISGMLRQLDMSPADLNGIAVAKGPGSYTGVRIGVATAKSMAWALGIPAVGVSSLQVLACNGGGFGGGIVPLFDARRGQVYTGLFRSDESLLAQPDGEERIILLQDWLAVLKERVGNQPLLFVGDDLSIHRAGIEQALGKQAVFAAASGNVPRAAYLGFLGLRMMEQADSPHHLNPEYLQLAEAEAKWLAANR